MPMPALLTDDVNMKPVCSTKSFRERTGLLLYHVRHCIFMPQPVYVLYGRNTAAILGLFAVSHEINALKYLMARQ